jgi:hypothetical protein
MVISSRSDLSAHYKEYYYRLARFVGPHLMSGNVMLLKHAPGVPQCAVAFEKVLKDADFHNRCTFP